MTGFRWAASRQWPPRTVALGFLSAISVFAQPAITSLNPSSATAGGPSFTLTVNGSNFNNGAIVQWNGTSLQTTFLSAVQLSAAVPATLIANIGLATVTVVSAAGTASNAARFTIKCSGNNFVVNVAGPKPGFVAVAGQPVDVVAFVTNTCSRAEPALIVDAHFSTTDNNVSLGRVAEGTWRGTWTPVALGPVQMAIYAIDPSSGILIRSDPVLGTVQSAGAPLLATSRTSLTFFQPQGENVQSQTFNVLNLGPGSVPFTLAVNTSGGDSWLQVDPSSGSTSADSPATITVSASPANLQPGIYSGLIAVRSATQSYPVVGVTMAVTSGQATLLLSQTGLSFTAAAGGGAPLPQDFGILNVGHGSMQWSAQTSVLSGAQGWLSLSSTNGTVARPFVDVALDQAIINPAGLTAGTYYGKIQISSPGAPNSPQTISVVLTVLPSGANPGPDIRPTGLIFVGSPAAGAGPQTVMISNTTASEARFNSNTVVVPPVATWFSNTPRSGTVVPNQPLAMTIQPDFSKLTQGTSRGLLTLLFDDGSARNVSLLAVVPPQSTTAASTRAHPHASGCTPVALNVQPSGLLGLQQTLAAAIGQPVTLEVRIVDSCGQPVTNLGSNSSVLAAFSNGDASGALQSLGDGRWVTTWQPQAPGSQTGLPTVTITALQPLTTGSILSSQTAILVTFGPPTKVPIVSSGGVLNAASFALSSPVAPGSLVTIFGANLTNGASPQFAPVPLPAQLGSTQVLLAGHALPLLYTSDGQINAQIPYDVPLNVPAQLLVQTGNTLSVPQTVLIAPAQPAVFTKDQSGHGQGVIINASQRNTLADVSAPASAGDVIVIYCTGLGAVQFPVPPGTAANDADPTIQPVVVNIGNLPAAVTYAGLTPGYAGLYQVNAIVPAGVTTGDRVPVVLSTSGQTSPAVTMAIH